MNNNEKIKEKKKNLLSYSSSDNDGGSKCVGSEGWREQ